MKVVDSNEFIEMINLSMIDEVNYNVDYNDEIVDIEYIGETELMDIDVTGNHLYYANDILTHNSAVNNTDASNDSVSDSIGTVQTADFIIFLLQNERMKEESLITCKVTKNRFTGRTDQWDMNIDYEHMRFNDLLVPTMSAMSENETEKIIQEQMKMDAKIISESDGSLLEEEFDTLSFLGIDT